MKGNAPYHPWHIGIVGIHLMLAVHWVPLPWPTGVQADDAAPPVQDRTFSANARAFNRWLVNDWLKDYSGDNVVVFDFYNVLTGPGNHHRFRDGRIEHAAADGRNTLYYPSDGDDHSSHKGNRKATDEIVPLINVYY